MEQYDLVKAEILWSRKCRLKCDYCNMVTGKESNKDISQWKIGMHNLWKLKCRFLAFYGAEPLEDYVGLPEIMRYISDLGFSKTLITSCITSQFDYKIKELMENGLDSITVSYDGEEVQDKYSSAKSKSGISELYRLQGLYGDKLSYAAVMTLTKKNTKVLPEVIRKMDSKGIWTFFDFLHLANGNPGTKCRTTPEGLELKLRYEDLPNVEQFLDEVIELKKAGAMIHCSLSYLEFLRFRSKQIIDQTWNCAKQPEFPSWLTIDYDGTVRYCDDFDVTHPIKFWGLDFKEKLIQNAILNKEYISEKCKGCIWNTHVDAHFIKSGLEDIKGYIHR